MTEPSAKYISKLINDINQKIDEFFEQTSMSLQDNSAYTLISGNVHIYTAKTINQLRQYMYNKAYNYIYDIDDENNCKLEEEDDEEDDEKEDDKDNEEIKYCELYDEYGIIVTSNSIFDYLEEFGDLRIQVDHEINWEKPTYLNITSNYFVKDLINPIVSNYNEDEQYLISTFHGHYSST
jgi:hypothetical protein